MDVRKYHTQIEQVINKYASDKRPREKDDLRQDAYTALIEAGEKVNSPQLAYKIAKDRVIDVLRKEWQHTSKEVPLSRSAENSSLPDFSSGIDLQDALAKLEPEEQLVINALFYERRTADEIGVVVGKSRQWVWNIKKSAIEKLKKFLSGEKK